MKSVSVRMIGAFVVMGWILASTVSQPVIAAERLVQLTIPGCSTPEIQADIDRIVKVLEGVQEVRADWKRHQALVAFDDDRIGLDAIKAVLDKKQYAVTYHEFLD